MLAVRGRQLIFIFISMVSSSEIRKKMYVDVICTSENTRRSSTGGSSTHKPSAGARMGIVRRPADVT